MVVETGCWSGWLADNNKQNLSRLKTALRDKEISDGDKRAPLNLLSSFPYCWLFVF